MTRINQWPLEDRPREKLLERGAEHLTETELLAILLGTGSAGEHQSALDQARALLMHFDGLSGIDDASIAELTGLKGLGRAKAARLKACLELGRRREDLRCEAGELLSSPEDVFRHFRPRCINAKRESFYVVLLTNRNRKIRDVKISEGSLTASVVHPREVFNPVIRESAAGVIFVHNHPAATLLPAGKTWTSPTVSGRWARCWACASTTTWWWGTTASSASTGKGSCEDRQAAVLKHSPHA